jgi:hypothetical protein
MTGQTAKKKNSLPAEHSLAVHIGLGLGPLLPLERPLLLLPHMLYRLPRLDPIGYHIAHKKP